MGEEVHAEVDEDEVFAQLCEDAEKVFGGALRAAGHRVVGVVLEGDAAEEEGDDAGHVQAVREEVGCVRDKGDKARLDLRVKREGGVFECEGGKEAKGNPEGHTAAEGEEEDANAVKDRADVDF